MNCVYFWKCKLFQRYWWQQGAQAKQNRRYGWNSQSGLFNLFPHAVLEILKSTRKGWAVRIQDNLSLGQNIWWFRHQLPILGLNLLYHHSLTDLAIKEDTKARSGLEGAQPIAKARAGETFITRAELSWVVSTGGLGVANIISIFPSQGL